jgi:CHAD domain-containing protein
LTVCRPLLDGAVGAANVELRWFLDELRPLHDVDLVRQRLSAAGARGSDPQQSGSDTVPERLLGKVRREALTRATHAWTSERFLDLSGALGQLFGANVMSPRAEATADAVFPELLAAEVRRLRTRAEQAQVTGTGERDERLHELRSAARRVRYAGTLVDQVDAARAARVQRHLKRLLTLLRDRHDSTVTRDCLEAVLRKGRLEKGSAAVVSRLVRQEEVTTSRLDRKLPRHISRAIALDTLLVQD